MADFERNMLNHYNLTNPFPVEWPAEKDLSDASDEEKIQPKSKSNAPIRRSKSRYSALERTGGEARKSVPGSERTGDGVENLVQKDEPDPLGGSDSVVRVLRYKGLPVEENTRLRNRFMLSSTTFSPALFLSQVHSTASTQSLLQGLEFLSRSIDQKSASLKVLVESNFERFVKAKSTIDSVYTEMRNTGAEPGDASNAHSRQTSRSSNTHFRNISGSGPSKSPGRGFDKPLPTPLAETKKKNALTKESEFGVQGIKAPLIEVAVKAEEVWGPALGGREREKSLKAVSTALEKYRGIFEVGGSIADSIKRRDYEALIEDYTRARKYADEARNLANAASTATRQQSSVTITDPQIYQIIVTAQMWADVETQIEDCKRDLWRRLVGIQTNLHASATASSSTATSTSVAGVPLGIDGGNQQPEEHMEIIGVLLELGVQDNPIWVWLLSRYDYLKNKITATSERFKIEIEVVRRRLAAGPKPSPQVAASYLRSSSSSSSSTSTLPTKLRGDSRSTMTLTPRRPIDTADVITLWEGIYTSLNTLLALRGGILSEVIDFWETAQSFIDGRTQRTLPVGNDGQSRRHHRLSLDGVQDLQKGLDELVNLIRESVFSFFADPPIDDISALFSPIPTSAPDTPATPYPPTPKSATLTPSLAFKDSRFNLDPNSIQQGQQPPPPSPRLGEEWEKFAFWPPYANSLSGVHYLGRMLVLIGTAASQMAAMSPIGANGGTLERLRSLVGGARERSVQAVCAAWNRDAERCKAMEDWTRAPGTRDVTRMPAYFAAFHGNVLSGMQKLLYISEALTKPGPADVVLPPPTKLLQMVRAQFVTSLYKSFGGMVENARDSQTGKPPPNGAEATENEWDASDPPDGLTSPAAAADNAAISTSSGGNLTTLTTIAQPINANDVSVRMLLTLSNLQTLRTDMVPTLITQFETAFSVKLTDESKKIRDDLGQIDARLFQLYTRPAIERLSRLIRDGVQSPNWAPRGGRPTEVRQYVYSALLSLVLVHTQVSTTAASLTPQIMSYLLEQTSRELLDAFKLRPRYTLAALMQATVDVEFVAQTLSQYTTDRASEIQAQIYQELDRGTDSDARARLQNELPEMRMILKTLRESSKTEL
ncbi:MAG: hypothetical protein M1825_005591 [Sarcosagium campestre]|nr:MAG: hypothetical protein M1825_005591 [Sarcosagium campestre]